MTTAGALIDKALRRSGVLGNGQVAAAQDTADCLAEFNQMLAQWARRRWLVYHLIDTSFACTGAQFYTVGAGGNFNITRPDRIEAAYLRQTVPATPTPVDYPLAIIESYEEYSRIALKGLTASPSECIFYDSGFPTGKIYPWPIPSSNYALHILTKTVLQVLASTADVLNLPPEYEDAIDWCLRQRFRSAYRLPRDPVIEGQARAALQTIRKANLQLDRLRMPSPIRRGGRYNIYSNRGG